jgi:hypothetical protein
MPHADWLKLLPCTNFEQQLTSVKAVNVGRFCPRTLLYHLNLSGTFSIMFARQALRPVTLLTTVR